MPVFWDVSAKLKKMLVISFTYHIQQHSTSNSDQKFLLFQPIRKQRQCTTGIEVFEEVPIGYDFSISQAPGILQKYSYNLRKIWRSVCRCLGEFLFFFESPYKWLPKFWFEVWLSEIAWGWKLPNLWVSWVKSCLS